MILMLIVRGLTNLRGTDNKACDSHADCERLDKPAGNRLHKNILPYYIFNNLSSSLQYNFLDNSFHNDNNIEVYLDLTGLSLLNKCHVICKPLKHPCIIFIDLLNNKYLIYKEKFKTSLRWLDHSIFSSPALVTL